MRLSHVGDSSRFAHVRGETGTPTDVAREIPGWRARDARIGGPTNTRERDDRRHGAELGVSFVGGRTRALRLSGSFFITGRSTHRTQWRLRRPPRRGRGRPRDPSVETVVLAAVRAILDRKKGFEATTIPSICKTDRNW